MSKAWWRRLLRRKKDRATIAEKRRHILGFEPLEVRNLLAGITLAPAQVQSWIAEGPAPIVNGAATNVSPPALPNNDPVIGGIQSLAIDPGNSNIAWAGTVNGGLWETTNLQTSSGPTWFSLNDQSTNTAIQDATSIGGISVDPTDATNNTVIVGLGDFSDFDGLTTVPGTISKPLGAAVTGLIEIKNATSATPTTTLLSAFGGVHDYIAVAQHGQYILAADDGFETFTGGAWQGGGLYQSSNGGSTATLLSGANGLPVGPVSSIAVNPADLNDVYVTVLGPNAGVYFTTSFGLTNGPQWTNVTPPSSVTGTSGAINGSDVNMIVSVGKAGPTVYVGVVDGSGALSGVYRAPANPAGPGTWVSMTSSTVPPINPAGDGVLDFSLVADPQNANIVYVGGDFQMPGSNPFPAPNAIGATAATGQIYRGTYAASGSTWSPLTDVGSSGGTTTPGGTGSAPHAESRTLVVDSSDNLYDADMGGIYKRNAPTGSAGSWTSVIGVAPTVTNSTLTITGLPTSELYAVADDPNSKVILGSGVNVGTFEETQANSAQYNEISQGNGGAIAVDTVSQPGTSVVYTSSQGLQNFQRAIISGSGARTQVTSPALTVLNPQTGTSTNENLYQWEAALSGGSTLGLNYLNPIAVDQSSSQYSSWLALGSQYVYESTDGGQTLTPVSTPNVAGQTASPINIGQVSALVYGGLSGGVPNQYLLWAGTSNGAAHLYVRLEKPNTLGGTVPPGGTQPPGGSVQNGAQLLSVQAYTGGGVTGIAVDPADDTIVFISDGAKVYQVSQASMQAAFTNEDQSQITIAGTFTPPVGTITSIQYVPGKNGGPDIIVVSGSKGVASATVTAPSSWSLINGVAGNGNTPLPAVNVESLSYDAKNDILFAATLGRGIWELPNFAATANGFALTVTGDFTTNGNDTVVFEISPTDPTMLLVSLDGSFHSPIAYASIVQTTVNLGGGQNTLDFNFTNGPSVPAGKLTYGSTNTGVVNTIQVEDDSTFTLTNTSLSIANSKGAAITLTNVLDAVFNTLDSNTTPDVYNLNNTWTGNATLNGSSQEQNTLNYTSASNKTDSISLGNSLLSLTGTGITTQTINLSNIQTANVTGGTGADTIDVSNWTGGGTISGGTNPGDNANTLTYVDYNATLVVFNGGALNAYGVVSLGLANLQTIGLMGASGNGGYTFDDTGWSGNAYITAMGTGNSLYSNKPTIGNAPYALYNLYTFPSAGFNEIQSTGTDTSYNVQATYATLATGVQAYYVTGANNTTSDVFNVSNFNGAFAYLIGGSNTTSTIISGMGLLAPEDQDYTLTNSGLFTGNGSVFALSNVQGVILDTVTGSHTVNVYSWSGSGELEAGSTADGQPLGTDQFILGGPSGSGNLDNVQAQFSVFGGGGSTLAMNDDAYDTGSNSMFYDVNNGTVTPDNQTPRLFKSVTFDSGVSNLVISGAAADADTKANSIKFLDIPSTTTSYTFYGDQSGQYQQDYFLGTFFFGTPTQDLYDDGVLVPNYVANNDYWSWFFSDSAHPGSQQPVYFHGIGSINGTQLLVLSGGANSSTTSQPLLQVYNPDTGQLQTSFLAYTSTFQGGVHVATGNFTPNDPSAPDYIVTAPGPGISDLVEVFNSHGNLITSFTPYQNYTSGVNVAVGNVTNDPDGTDIIVAPEAGNEPVEVWQVSNVTTTPVVTLVRSFNPYGTSYIGGIQVAAGDINKDGFADVVTGPEGGMAALVKVYDGQAISTPALPVDMSNGLITQFYAFQTNFLGGVSLAVDDADGDGIPDIAVGAGSGGNSQIAIFSGASVDANSGNIKNPTITTISSFQAFVNDPAPTTANLNTNAPLDITMKDVFGDGRYAIFVAQGARGNSNYLSIYQADTGQYLARVNYTGSSFAAGVSVG